MKLDAATPTSNILRDPDFRRLWLSNAITHFSGGAEQVFLTFVVGRDKLVDAQSRLGALRQKVTHDAMLGRMIATMRFLTVAMAPVGATLAGALGQRLGVQGGMYCVAAGATTLMLATAFASAVHKVRD